MEDNADVIYYMTTSLKDHFDIKVTMNGKEGLEKALETIPDIIVSDVMMPLMDGFELCETIKNDTRTSHIPLILLTAKADAESKLDGLRREADAFLAKPFNPEELLIRLQVLIEGRKKLQRRYLTVEAPPSENVNIQIED